MKYETKIDETGSKYIELEVEGYDIINNPILNKGRSFTPDERSALHLKGIVPPAYLPLDEVVEKNYQIVLNSPNDLERHIFLRNLQDRNETLFYAMLDKYTEEIMPLVYTPVVGQACQKFGRIYRRSRGVFISYLNREYIDSILDHAHFDEVEVIVVSDGERILGLGDQGAGGMGIPIGKLSLYTGCAGIAPQKTLPIVLDVGTDNEELLNDPLYLGWRHKRVRGADYDDFVDEFVNAVKKRFPHVLLHWEDFAQNNALKLLNKYRNDLCTFNDDIQGTASIVLGVLLSANKASGIELTEQKIVVVGAGSAGTGISNLIVDALVDQGLTRQQAYKSFYLVDRFGLITDNIDSLDFQKPFSRNSADVTAWNIEDSKNITLLETIKNAKATMIIGICAQGGIFTKEVIEAMAANCERPIIFPLSNPTEKAEADPRDVLKWTNGKAIVGTGTAFPMYDTGNGLRRIDQVNNSYIFTGLGLGVLVVKSKLITDKMFLVASKALAELSPAAKDPNANLLPPLSSVRKVSLHVALAVAKEAIAAGLTEYKSLSDYDLNAMIKDYVWEPVYLPYRKKAN